MRVALGTLRTAMFAMAFAAAAERAAAAAPAAPQPSKAVVESSLMMRTIDHFAAQCERSGGFNSGDRAIFDAWQKSQRAAQAREQLRALEAQPGIKQQMDSALVILEKAVATQNVDSCKATLAFARLPAAQFPTAYPELFAAAPASSTGGPTTVAPPTGIAAVPAAGTTGKAPAPLPSARNQAATLAALDSFGFDTRPTMGIGGFIGIDVYPVALFRDGRALTDVEGIAFPAGLGAHQAQHADDWTRWRRNGGKLELLKDGKWDVMEFQTTYARLPDDFRLDGLFRSTRGSGNIAIGGTDSVVAWNEYRFSRDGRVLRGGGAGAFATGGDFSTATSSASPDRRGRYRIEGLLLNISYDDGSRESRILITDPKDATRVLWLDGAGYVRR